MKKMNLFFAVAFAAIALVALYGAFCCGAHWHVFTAIFAAFLAMVFLADSKSEKTALKPAKRLMSFSELNKSCMRVIARWNKMPHSKSTAVQSR